MTFSLWFNLQEVWGLLFFTLHQGPFSQNPSMKMFDFFFFPPPPQFLDMNTSFFITDSTTLRFMYFLTVKVTK